MTDATRHPQTTDLMRLILVMAPSFQGGHSQTGSEIADLFGIPFPLRMDNLAKAARARGFDPDHLWPWWKKMREDREEAKRKEHADG